MAGSAGRAGLERSPEAETARAFARVADLIESRLDEVAADLTEANRREIPGYVVPPGAIRESMSMIERVLDRFRRGEAFGEEDAVELSRRAHGWAAALPFDVIAESFHVSARRFVALVTESASELELNAALVLAVQDRAWEWAMFAARVIADVQREQAVAAARRDASRRAEFLRDLALGRMTVARLVEESAVYGLDTAQPYFAVVALSDDPAGSAFEARIRQSGATSTHRVLQATIDGRLLALTPRRPKAPPGATVAVGPPMQLSDVHDSFVEAEEALAAATAFGIAGTVDLTAVGPFTLVTVADRVAARLADRYFGDLGESFSEVEDTVLTLLDQNQSIEETAAAMHLHRNTVRYRVTRFRELTGLDIRRTHDLVTTWWLLEWRRARTRS
ncbi:MAG TPA: helix-turn-helix domain-containing protein [Solirubrobacteraceae bacterium]|nr:helix-turn-helix domain-containing protein [Solirubrobacteraceae bacterium]